MMKFGSLRFLIAIALCMIDPAAEAADISPVGTWSVKSFSQQILDTNETIRPYGDVGNPKKPGSFPFTDAERAEIHKGIFGAYAGRYSVEGNKVTHHIEVSWRPDWIGDNQVRYLEIDGRKLTIKTAPLTSAVNGKRVVSTLMFERAD